MDPTSATLFLERSRYYLNVEYRTKLGIAVAVLPPGGLWSRPNEASNSVGNLLIHLAGNLRQWILSGVGGAPLSRDRAGEFAARDGAAAEVLLADLDRVLADVDRVIASIPAARLSERVDIQGREVTVLEAIYHVVEHFAYHLGQIVMVSKQLAPGGVRFYEDAGGLARPLWHT